MIEIRGWMRLVENQFAAGQAITDRVAAMPSDEQHRLAKVLAETVYAWVVGDPMYSGENQSFVDGFRYLAPLLPTLRRRKLRTIYRGALVDHLPDDWQDGTAKRAVTSLKPLQSWSAKLTVAREFTDPNKQEWIKGQHPVVFAAKASTLPVLFTMIDLRDCYLSLMDGLSYEAKDPYTSLSHSEFLTVFHDLERYAKQDEVVVLAAPGAMLPVTSVTVQVL